MARTRRSAALLTAGTMIFGCAVATAGAAAATTPRSVDATGKAKATAPGDFDGDGRTDFAVGAPGANEVRVTYTSAKVHGSHTATLKPSSHAAEKMNFGATLALGDFNGDGYADLAVAAPQYTNATDVGAVFVYFGSKSGLKATPQLIVDPDQKDSDIDFANTIALARGDQNGDGYADLAVGSPNSVRVYHGSKNGLKIGSPARIHVDGADSLVLADVNGDGHTDVVVGRSVGDVGNGGDEYGQIDVFLGHAHGTSAQAHSIVGNQVGEATFPYEGFGSTIVAGDFNGDGRTDIAAGVPGGKQAGADRNPGNICVLFGTKHGLSKSDKQLFDAAMAHPGAGAEAGFGTTIAAGDINGDGYDDLAVDSPDAKVSGKASAGAVAVIHGSKGGLTAAKAQWLTAATGGVPGNAEKGATFGAALFIADLTGGSAADLAIGVPNAGADDHGSAIVLRGTGTKIGTSGAHSYSVSTHDAMFGSAVR